MRPGMDDRPTIAQAFIVRIIEIWRPDGTVMAAQRDTQPSSNNQVIYLYHVSLVKKAKNYLFGGGQFVLPL